MDILDYFYGMDRNLPNIQNKEVRELHDQAAQQLHGADFVFTSFTEGNRDNSITMDRAEQIINDLLPGDFRLEPTFIKWDNDHWKIEKSRNPLRDSKKKNLLTLNRHTKPGALVGIDSLFYDVAYPVTVVLYAGYEIKKPDAKKLKPMRHPGNCVAKLIKEFYSDSTRGGKLTQERLKAISAWQKNVQRSGNHD